MFAFAREKLDAAILAIAHIDDAVGIDRDPMHDVKLPRPRTGFAPGLDEPAIGRIAMHAGVAVAVGDEHVAADSYARGRMDS